MRHVQLLDTVLRRIDEAGNERTDGAVMMRQVAIKASHLTLEDDSLS